MDDCKITVLFVLACVYNVQIDLVQGLTADTELTPVRRPYIDDPSCPRQEALIQNRKCLKKCRSHADCRGKNKKCLCDDACGRSCVKPNLECKLLKPIFQGSHSTEPYNTFGAIVTYTCNEGYVLSGKAQRVCQGDGYWSGEAPTCETEGRCGTPPTVPKASYEGPTDQTTYPLGTQLVYACDEGYTKDGFFKAMCVGEGRWIGPRMTCSAERCGNPGSVAHGRRLGDDFMFPHRVTYQCDEGYELVGRSYRVCLANGEWSGEAPTCEPVQCPALSSPANGFLRFINLPHSHHQNTFGDEISFSCHQGFRLTGSAVRRCQQNGRWSGTNTSCITVDCGTPKNFYNGYLDGQRTTFGSVISFRCFGRTTFEGEANSTTCQFNGSWSHPVPKCWSKCEVPYVANGTVVGHVTGAFVPHNTVMTVTCTQGSRLSSEIPAKCVNGTWQNRPACDPAPCNVRPPDISNGIMRYHGMHHGDKAKYVCNTGFEFADRLNDNSQRITPKKMHTRSENAYMYMNCSYGAWRGKTPVCKNVLCQWPGRIAHGEVKLVGKLGSYVYKDYVMNVGHNEKIEFVCRDGYKRRGPAAATCVDGEWSPLEKPTCSLGQHPIMMQLYRGKRSAKFSKKKELETA